MLTVQADSLLVQEASPLVQADSPPVQEASPPVRAALPVEVPALQLLVRPVRASTPNLEPDLNYDSIARFQREDNDLREVLKWAEQQQRPPWEEVSSGSSEVKFWWARYEKLVIEHGILYIRWEPTRPTDQARLRVLTPRGLRSTVIKHFHDQKTAGHLGVAKTFSKLCRGNFYWPSMLTSTRRWVQNCQECQRCKPPARAKRAKMVHYQVGAAMERIAVDIMGPQICDGGW